MAYGIRPLLSADKAFILRVSIGDGCWLWQGATRSFGYGCFYALPYKHYTAHRFAYEHFVGPIPEGLLVLHKCDNPACVNPAHLFLGTSQDNMDDRNQKGRNTRGESHPKAKLNREDAIEIRRLYTDEFATVSDIGRQYNKDASSIIKILKSKTWKCLGLPPIELRGWTNYRKEEPACHMTAA